MNQETTRLLDTIKDALGGLGVQVLSAYTNDGHLSTGEIAMIGVSAVTYLLPIANAVMALSKTGVEELLDTLKNSDIVVRQ